MTELKGKGEVLKKTNDTYRRRLPNRVKLTAGALMSAGALLLTACGGNEPDRIVAHGDTPVITDSERNDSGILYGRSKKPEGYKALIPPKGFEEEYKRLIQLAANQDGAHSEEEYIIRGEEYDEYRSILNGSLQKEHSGTLAPLASDWDETALEIQNEAGEKIWLQTGSGSG